MGLPLEDIVMYELHVGAFTKEGTIQPQREKEPPRLLKDRD